MYQIVLKKKAKKFIDKLPIATDKMVRNAEQMGADAVVCVRYSSSEVMQGAAEVLVYGTAVRLI